MATNLPKNVSKFVLEHQQRVLTHNPSSEEFKGLIDRLDKEIVEIPDYPQKQSEAPGSMHDRLTVYAHFFDAGCDWFIIDWDREDDILFCYAIIGGDVEMSELGTTFLSDLTSHGRVELDFYWKKRTLAQVLYDKYPSYFSKPYKVVPVVRIPNITRKRRKLLKAKLNKQQAVKQKDWREKIKFRYQPTYRRQYKK